MGCFSWKCAVSGESLANVYSGKPKEQTECYLITPNETIFENSYKGYGVFGGKNIYEISGDEDTVSGIRDTVQVDKTPKFEIKIVLAKHYKGQTYDELPVSESCPYQGFFFLNN